jgi:hypothetical protein
MDSQDKRDMDDPEGEEEEPKKEDVVKELFSEEEEEEPKHKKKGKKKDEFDELFEQSQGNGEDIYATEDFDRYDPGVSD